MGADDLRNTTTLVGPFAEYRRQGGIGPVGPPVQGGRGLQLDGEPPEVLERLAAALDRPVPQCDCFDLGVEVTGEAHVGTPYGRRFRALLVKTTHVRGHDVRRAAPVALTRAPPAAAGSAESASCTAVHGVTTGWRREQERANTPEDGGAQVARAVQALISVPRVGHRRD